MTTKKSGKAIGTLVALFLVASLAVGCKSAGANSNEAEANGVEANGAEATEAEMNAETAGSESSTGVDSDTPSKDEDVTATDKTDAADKTDESAATEKTAPADKTDKTDKTDEASDHEALGEETSPATVEVTEATDELVGNYADFDVFDAATDEYGVRCLLTTDKTIREIKLYRLTWDEDAEDIVNAGDDPLYQQKELTPERPLVVCVSFPGTMPTVGLEFTDADGTPKKYQFVMSGMDGSVQLMEATSASE